MKPLHPSPGAYLALTLTALLMAAPISSNAAVIMIDFSSAPKVIPNTLDGLYLNLVTGTISTASVPPVGWDINPYNSGTGFGFFAPAVPSGQGTLASGPTALSLLGGQTIGLAGIYQPDQALGTNFQITGIHYAGFRFLNESTGTSNYGWIKLSTTGGAGSGFPAKLLGYAYENTGAAITAGQIPEPATSGLLAWGTLAWAASQRRARPAPHQ